MQGGTLLLIAIVLCASLLLRLLISHFFSQSVFDKDSSLPLVPGIDKHLSRSEEQAKRKEKRIQENSAIETNSIRKSKARSEARNRK